MKKLLLVTPTRNRPHEFSLLESYMKRQTFQDFDWIVCCDGDADNYTFTMGQEVIRRDPSQDPEGAFSHCLNYLAMPLDGDRLVFVDDDDWYRKDFLERINALLDEAPLVGLSPALYYHTKNRAYTAMWNISWASLAATAIRREVVPMFVRGCTYNKPYLDLHLWNGWFGDKTLVSNDGLHVGLKDGTGIGIGHRLKAPVDRHNRVLEAWLGEDAANYPGEIPADAPESDDEVIFASN